LAAYHHDEGSIRPLAQRFNVRARFVGELVIRFHRTGSCAPQPHGGGNPPGIARSTYESLVAWGQEYPDATRKELGRLLEARGHLTARTSRMPRTLAKRQLPRKTRPGMRRNAIPRRCESNAAS